MSEWPTERGEGGLSVVDVLDLLQCPVCGTFYKPATTATGRTLPHCVLPACAPHLNRVEWMDGEVYVDWVAIEARVVQALLTEGVVDPPLTGSLLDIEV